MKDMIYRDDAVALVIKAIHGTDNKEIQNYLFGGLRKQMWSLPSAEAIKGECRTCGRNANNGGEYEDGRTKCPIQEHYALLKDGYCHLYEPYREDGKL